MKRYPICLSFLLTVLALVLLPASCSKTSSVLTTSTTDSSTQIIMANDELNINYEFDQAVNEALLATSLCYIASGDTMTGTGNVLYNTVSQAIIDTSRIIDSSLVHVEYYGKNADGTKGRTGTVTAVLSRDGSGHIIPWDRPGATMTLLFQQYEVIVLATNVSLWINGTATITNVTGGQLTTQASILLPAGDSLQDKVSAYLQFTYNDNTGQIVTYPWTLNQTRTFNIQNALLTSTIRGDTAIGGVGGVSTSGTTRFSYAFLTQTTAPVVQSISSSYLLSEPLSGQKVITGIPEPITILYGTNSSGTPVQSAPYGYRMSWVHSGAAVSSVVAY